MIVNLSAAVFLVRTYIDSTPSPGEGLWDVELRRLDELMAQLAEGLKPAKVATLTIRVGFVPGVARDGVHHLLNLRRHLRTWRLGRLEMDHGLTPPSWW